VQGNEAWTDTGITVQRGQQVRFTTTGEIQVIEGRSASASGLDSAAMDTSRYTIPGMGLGGLIGRVGTSAPFRIGTGSEPVSMPASGRLFLGINDDHHADNRGTFRVAVETAPAARE
jgi:hypothetical protein